MKLDWERVRLLIWLRRCQTRHALARHGRAWGADLQHIFTFVFAAIALIGGLAAGYFLLESSEVTALLAWDFWAAFVCYLWMSALAAEAQRADPIDAGRLLHLPVSLREAFVINFAASLYNMPNIVGLASALGLAGGHAVHHPAALAVLPAAVFFLLMVSAWAQVLRAWFLKVFRNPRRRRWLSIVAGIILALAGQLPNLVNMLNMHLRPRLTSVVSEQDQPVETYDPAWATLPPGTVITSDNLIVGSESKHQRIYVMPGKKNDIYRVTYERLESSPGDGNEPGTIIWRATFWQVRDGVWRRAESDPPDPMQGTFTVSPGERREYSVEMASKSIGSLDGVPADLRDLWPYEERYKSGEYQPTASKLGSGALTWHAVVPVGWPAWISVSGTRGSLTFPLLAAFAGFAALIWLGLRRAWSIQRDAVLMTETLSRRAVMKPSAPVVPWSPARDKSSALTKPLAFFGPSISTLARAFLRQWARSVEIRFQIIVACGLAGGAVGFGLFLWWTDRSTAGAFHVVSTIVGLTNLAFMGLFLNFFGYDRSACRAMILAPVSSREVLLAKNAAVARLVMFTSLPFVAIAAVISGEWFMSALAWILLAPAAVLLCLALGNSSSVANPTPIRLGQRAQARPETGMGNGCLHGLLYLLVSFVIQIPQLLVWASGEPWVGAVTAMAVLGTSWAVWRGNLNNQVRQLRNRFPDVADAVGKTTDM